MITCTNTKMGYSKNLDTQHHCLLTLAGNPDCVFALSPFPPSLSKVTRRDAAPTPDAGKGFFSCQSLSTEERVKFCAYGAFSFISVWQQQVEKPQRS